MNLAELSVRRPIFMVCLVFLILVIGLLSFFKLGVDLFPNVTFPVVTVSVPYRGAGPQEIETLVSRPLEDEVSGVSGIKTLRSINKEGVSVVIAEFTLETDIKYAEQQIRDRVASARRKLPKDIDEPVIRRIDPSDQPVVLISVSADLPPSQLYDLANEEIRPRIEQVNQVGLVEVLGGRKREIRVELDRNLMRPRQVSATGVSNRISLAGQNIPAGKVDSQLTEMVYRTLGEFRTLKDIESVIVNLTGNEVPMTVGDVGRVVDALEDEKSRTYVNTEKALLISVYRQTGSNTVAVVDAVKKRVEKMNTDLSHLPGKPKFTIVRDLAKNIRANVEDVEESIFIGILLTILVVFYFLGSFRSTLITSVALPTSLIGAFILMAVAGFTINVMSLLALSLAVGLLIDDAIVVRENIFRHMEMGKPPLQAALEGTKEVTLAVVATSLTVIAVFGPIGFLQGVVGQFFKQFGLTICFAMAISLFDALTMAPMLSAYFAGQIHNPKPTKNPIGRLIGRSVKAFDRFQTMLENLYERVIRWTLKHPLLVLSSALGIFLFSLFLAKYVPKTFLPAQDIGEFSVSIEAPPGTSIDATNEVARKVEASIRENKEISLTVLTVGNRDGESNMADIYTQLVPAKQRTENTSQFKERLRKQLTIYADYAPKVKDVDSVGGGQRPFNLNIVGTDLEKLEEVSRKVFDKLKGHPALLDVDLSYRTGKPELQVSLNNREAELSGITSTLMGQELRAQIEGQVPALFRENGRQYDIRVRLKDDQRDLKRYFNDTWVPNVNNTLVRLSAVAQPKEVKGLANITRQDRGRYFQIAADINPNGPGMGGATQDIQQMFEKEPLPAGISYAFVGQAESFKELVQNIIIAIGLSILFIYLVLASLYESFITPFAIMLVLPLASCGAFFALFLSGKSLDIFSMIGCVMLLGLATKNSILLVDYTNQLMDEGMDRANAIVKAGRVRLRPILMTSVALIAGMLPVAIGLNEASRQRTSMGIAIIGGLVSSTLLTLVVIPAAYTYIDTMGKWLVRQFKKRVQGETMESALAQTGNAQSRNSQGRAEV